MSAGRIKTHMLTASWHWSYMVKFPCSGDQSCSCVHDTLQFFRQFFRQTIEQTIAIIKSWCDISMDCSFGWFICQISTVVGELPDLKKGFLDLMVDMGHHGVIEVHNNIQVSNSFWRRYTGLSDLNMVQMYRWAKFWAEYHHFSFRVIEF